jgi:hypothetical protein
MLDFHGTLERHRETALEVAEALEVAIMLDAGDLMREIEIGTRRTYQRIMLLRAVDRELAAAARVSEGLDHADQRAPIGVIRHIAATYYPQLSDREVVPDAAIAAALDGAKPYAAMEKRVHSEDAARGGSGVRGPAHVLAELAKLAGSDDTPERWNAAWGKRDR